MLKITPTKRSPRLIDEIFADGVGVHIEQLDRDVFMMHISKTYRGGHTDAVRFDFSYNAGTKSIELTMED